VLQSCVLSFDSPINLAPFQRNTVLAIYQDNLIYIDAESPLFQSFYNVVA